MFFHHFKKISPVLWGKYLLQKLVPPLCWSCRRFINSSDMDDSGFPFLCRSCLFTLPWIDKLQCCLQCGNPNVERRSLRCPLCIEHQWWFDRTWSCFIYEDIVRQWILQFKFGGKVYLAPMLGRLMALSLQTCQLTELFDVCVPVPLHPSRLRWRGYNQSLILTHYLQKNLENSSKPVYPQWLKRVRPTKPQTELSAANRFENVNDAFIASDKVNGLRVLVIDDIMTTGATLNAVARTLKDAGAVSVIAGVFAKRQYE